MTESSSGRSHQCFCIETFKLSTLWTALEVIQQEILHTNWWYVFTELLQILLTTFTYIWTIYELVYKGLKYENIPHHNLDQWARVQVYHLAQTFKLWELPHYRAPSYQADLIANLKNVAIPGTGIPLSWFCTNYYVAFAFICLGNPIICFVGALKTEIEKAFCETSTQSTSVDVNSPIGKKFYLEAILLESFKTYLDYLLHPTDWFNLWRLNSSVVALHSHVTKATSNSYDQENKWEFIKHGLKLGVPVTPIITDIETIVCKHKNVEGGMGIYFYDNANCGGDWIIQVRTVFTLFSILQCKLCINWVKYRKSYTTVAGCKSYCRIMHRFLLCGLLPVQNTRWILMGRINPPWGCLGGGLNRLRRANVLLMSWLHQIIQKNHSWIVEPNLRTGCLWHLRRRKCP